jgi:hypothetical protein
VVMMAADLVVVVMEVLLVVKAVTKMWGELETLKD